MMLHKQNQKGQVRPSGPAGPNIQLVDAVT